MYTEKSENMGIQNIKLSQEKYDNMDSDVLICALTKEKLAEMRKSDSGEMSKVLKATLFRAEFCETDLVPNIHDKKPKRYLFVGLDEGAKLDLEKIRKAYAAAIRLLKFSQVNDFTVLLPDLKFEKHGLIKAIVEGLLLGDYHFDRYKTLEPRAKEIRNMTVLAESKYKELVEETQKLCNNVNLVRDWVNESGSIEHPEEIVEMSKSIADANKLKIKILDASELKEQGLNLIYSVGKGSKHSPYLIIMEYNGNPDSKERIAVIGKGLTFDSGGMNLKPETAMQDMKCDMAGAATVLGLVKTAAELRLKKNIIAVIGTAENMIGPDAYKPGDILKSYNGITVEVANTDAEGRLVLADAISYTVRNYKPDLIIDLATLTGAVVVALGVHTIGMFSNDSKAAQLLEDAGKKVYERVWSFPMFQEYKDDIKSEIADLRNLGPKGQAGSINGAVFLEPFAENTPWVHLDIVGVAFLDKERGYLPKGGTGTGLRLLVEFLKK
ncbi:MAG: leucyl aminopeptidase [Candidatus Nanoarchaeia archaeon]|nr:leucyl aminopeptidase [Candidatus Nanoarchaeia archaeon]MDD5239422.1 leucyl aminopeptidase [Candidatus Nanoarchaeia archaeon]